MRKIILASASPRRKQLLKQIGLDFTVIPSAIEEKLNPRLKPLKQVEVLSAQKAQSVAETISDTNTLIIASDTMVFVGDEMMGKPKDEKDALRMLRKLSDRMHSIVTGYTIIDTKTKKQINRAVETKIWFRKISPKERKNYLLKAKPWDKAGAYGIQDYAALFVDKIEGDYSSVLGLPLSFLAKDLKKFGIEVL